MNPNYLEGICACLGLNGVLLDGTQLSMKSSVMKLINPWRVSEGDKLPLVDKQMLIFRGIGLDSG